MFSHKHNFQCFNTEGHEGSRSSSLHHVTCLPTIPQHGMVAYHEPEKICYLCSEYRHPRALDASKTEVLPLYYHPAPYQNHYPHRCLHGRPVRPEEAHSGRHHHRHSKRVVLVKNSDPSISKTIVLHRRSIRSLGLFLEEASELMQYDIRKLYTPDGCKIDSVQSLVQCPSILVCVGHEPSHPSVVENFTRSSNDKLPQFNLRSPSNGCTEGHEGRPTHKSVINPKLECDNRSIRHSVSDNSLPDGTDSPDNVDSCSPTGDGLRHDDIEKRVHVNKDGSLSMEMKVHFRLQNDETLHWSTKVKKIRGKTCEHLQRHNNANFTQFNERSYVEPENIMTGEQDEPHCLHCGIRQHGAHGASRHSQTSSSSASSHTVVSRKTVTERHIMSRSSEDHVEKVEKETCIKQIVEAAETDDYCTIRSDTSQILTDHEGDQNLPPNASRGSSQNGQPEREESTVLDNDSRMQHKSPNLADRASQSSVHSTKSRKSQTSHTCRCGVSNVNEESEIQPDQSSAMSAESHASSRTNTSEKILNTECGDVEEKRSESAMSAQSNTSAKSISDDEKERLKSEKSEKSIKSEEGAENLEEGGVEQRALSSMSSKSKASNESKRPGVYSLPDNEQNQDEQKTSRVTSPAPDFMTETPEATPREDSEDKFGENVCSPESLKPEDTDENVDEGKEAEEAEDDQDRVQSVMSSKSNTSARSNSKISALEDEDSQERTSSAMSQKSSKSKYSQVHNPQTAARMEIADEGSLTALSATSSNKAENDEAVMDSMDRSPSTVSVKSTKSYTSTKSRQSRISESLKNAIHDEIQAENEDRQSERSLSPMSVKSNVSAMSSNLNTDEVKGPLSRAISAMSAKSDVSAGRPQSTMSVKSNISMKSGKSKHSQVSIKASDESHYDKNASCNSKEDETPNSCVSDNKGLNSNDDTEERATSVTSEIPGKSESSARSAKSKAFDDNSEELDNNEEITARAASTVSAKSAKSNTSAVSTNSNVKCNGDICDEGNDARELSERSPSCMSAKSATSNISERPANSKSCGGSEKRRPSVLSVKSAKSLVSVTSSKSTLSCTLNISELNGFSAEENTADSKEPVQRAPSNLSTSSAKSLKSNASAISKKSRGCAIPSENGDTASENVEETEGTSSLSVKSGECSAQGDFQNHGSRTESSMSVRSVHSHVSKKSSNRAPSAVSVKSAKSHISSKATKSTASGARSTKTSVERDGGEEMQESTATKEQDAPAEENISVHEEHAERAPSNMSIKSLKSKKSNVSKISDISETPSGNSLDQPDERNVEEASEGRAVSSMSGQTGISALSNKPKCPADALGIEPSTAEVAVEQTEERVETSMSARSAKSPVSVSDNTLDRSSSALSGESRKSHASPKCTKPNDPEVHSAKNDEKLDDLMVNGNGCSESRSVSVMSLPSLKSSVSGRSNVSKCSSNDPDEESTARPRSHKSTVSMKSNVSECPPHRGYEVEIQIPENDNNLEHAANKSENRLQNVASKKSVTSTGQISDEENADDGENNEESAQSAVSNKLLPHDISVTQSSKVPDKRIEEEKSKRATSVMSGKSVISARSKKSAASVDVNKSARRPRSSSSVKSNLSKTSHKSKPKDTLSDKDVQKNEEEQIPTASSVPAEDNTIGSPVNPEDELVPTSSLHEEDEHEDTNDKSCHPQTSKSSEQDNKTVTADVIASAHQLKGNEDVISHTESSESDLSQTLSSSDNVKETHETVATGESDTCVSNKLTNAPVGATNFADNQSDKCKQKNTDADDLELVPSSLPNASPSEVVNEWLKTITTHGDVYDTEELSENNDGQKNDQTTEETDREVDNANKTSSADDDPKCAAINGVPNTNCQANAEAPKADDTSAPSDDTLKVFHSSVHVMKVLLKTKTDRCNSLPEISPVYGRKLSTSATGLLDCLVKLQLINHDPKNANAKNGKYQELMNILKSLWLCDPPENEHMLKKHDDHYVADGFNHTSSSGVDVTSGSTVSGKSSDGVNRDLPKPHTRAMECYSCEGEPEADVQRTTEKDKNGDDPATDDRISKNDSPGELSETAPSLSKSSENDSSTQNALEKDEGGECQEDNSSTVIKGAQLAKTISHDLDAVWVLTLLTKIEKQFMTNYVNAMAEFKVRWNLDDNEQLDTMISELKTEVHKRIKTSINKEMRKIQSRAGIPRPPTEALSRVSTTQTEKRRRRLKVKLKQSADPQGGGSDDSATGTTYSDQLSENDQFCPCETCIKKKKLSKPVVPAEVMNIAPVAMDFDLKRILVMKNDGNAQANKCTPHSKNDTQANAVDTLLEKVITGAVKEVEGNTNKGGIVVDESQSEKEAETVDDEEESPATEADDSAKENNKERNTMEDISDRECDKGEAVTEGETDDEEEVSTQKAQESADVNYDMAEESSQGTAEQVSTEDSMVLEKENEVTGEDTVTAETSLVQTAAQETVEDDVVAEVGTVGGEEESTTTNEAPETTTSDGVTFPNIHRSDKEETVEDGAVDDDLPTSEGHSVNENSHTITADESSEETAEKSKDGVTAGPTATKVKNVVDSDEVESDSDDDEDDDADNESAVEDDIAATSEDELEEEAAEDTAAEEENEKENETTGDEQPKEPTVEATIEDDCAGTRGEEETTEASESEKEEEATDVSTDEDEKVEEKHESSKDENLERGTVSDEEKIASASADENNDPAAVGDLSKEPTEGEISAGKKVAREDDSKGETTEDKTTDENALGDETSKTAEETATTQDESAAIEEKDATSEEESMEERVEEEKPAKESDVAATSDGESDEGEAMEAEMGDDGEETAGTNDEGETTVEDESDGEKDDNDAEEEKDATETTEQESDKDTAVEEEVPAASAHLSGEEETAGDDISAKKEHAEEVNAAEEENAKDVADEAEYECDKQEAVKTDSAEETAASSEDDSAEGVDSTNDESSDVSCLPPRQETSKDGDKHNTVEAVPQSIREEIPKAVTENESEEENHESDTESNESVTDANDSEGGEDSSKASIDSETGDEGDAAEDKDKNETSSDAEHVEKASGEELHETEPSKENEEFSASVKEEDADGEEDDDDDGEQDKEPVESEKAGQGPQEAVTTEDETEERETEDEEAGSENMEDDDGDNSGAEGASTGEEQTEEEEPSEDGCAQDDKQPTRGEDEEKKNPDKAEHTSDECDMIEECQEKQEGPDGVMELKENTDVEEMSSKSVKDVDEDNVSLTERNVTQCEGNNMPNRGHGVDEDNVQASEDEDWSGVPGDSADGQDEAEDDSEESGEESDGGTKKRITELQRKPQH